MKPMTVELKPPITEHCSQCEFQSSYSLYCNRIQCPACGGSMRRGRRPRNYIKVSDNHKGVYTFRTLPNGRRYTFMASHALDYSDLSDLVDQLRSEFKHNAEKTKELRYIEKCLKDPEQHRLRLLDERDKIEEALYRFYWENGDDLRDNVSG